MGAIEQIDNNNVNEKVLLPQDIGTDYTFKRKIVWFNVIGFAVLHLAALYGVYRGFYSQYLTVVWALFLMFMSGEGITLGAHRYYSHRAFKATLFIRLLAIILHTVAGQNCLYIWVRDHRQHHKYSDTDADPHNCNRGFFFSHIGWLMSRKHPAVISKGKTIDLTDLEEDFLVMFQKDHYKFLYTIFAIGIPVAVPIYGWGETFYNSLFVCYFARYIIMLHGTWLINSAAHLYGTRPYDKSMSPVENGWVSLVALGEGWHNYHHAFPSDYRAAEYGLRYSVTTFVIDILATLGLLSDLREVKSDQVKVRTVNKGDGSHPMYGDTPITTLSEDFFNEKEGKEKGMRARHIVASG